MTSPAGWSYDLQVGAVAIGTPCYGGQVVASFASSLAETVQEFGRRGIAHSWIRTEKESLVQRARNVIAARFLAEERYTHLIWIDADVEWQALDVIRLLAHDVPAICGLYPKKTEKLEFPVHLAHDENGLARRDPRTGRIEIENAPTGFLCLKREVFTRLIEAYPENKITAMQGQDGKVLDCLYDFFPARLDDGILWSEDYGFCRLWRAIGGEVWMDPAIKLRHHGHKAYDGDPAILFSFPEGHDGDDDAEVSAAA